MKFLFFILVALSVLSLSTAYQHSADQNDPPMFLDHGEVLINDGPDIPGEISIDGKPPIAVTAEDVPDPTQHPIYH